MDSDTFGIGTPLVRLMMEIGYLASGNGFSAEAEAIFEGLRAVRPRSEVPIIGLAVNRMNAGRPLEAVSLLQEQALRLCPGSELGLGFLGLALRLAGHTGRSQSVLKDLAAKATNPHAGAMARALLADQV
jgi:hypothetical protein